MKWQRSYLMHLLAFQISNFAYLFKICQYRLWKLMQISFESCIIEFDEMLVTAIRQVLHLSHNAPCNTWATLIYYQLCNIVICTVGDRVKVPVYWPQSRCIMGYIQRVCWWIYLADWFHVLISKIRYLFNIILVFFFFFRYEDNRREQGKRRFEHLTWYTLFCIIATFMYCLQYIFLWKNYSIFLLTIIFILFFNINMITELKDNYMDFFLQIYYYYRMRINNKRKNREIWNFVNMVTCAN